MAARTYIVGLRLVLKHAKRYINKWGIPLLGELTAPQIACLTATIEAIDSCLAAIPEPAIND